jgi:hypothetical protein
MAYLVHERHVSLIGADGQPYSRVRVYAREMPGGTWEGWLEFLTDGGEIVASDRETTQPKQEDVAYWATGLETVYLEGALRRALEVRAPAR